MWFLSLYQSINAYFFRPNNILIVAHLCFPIDANRSIFEQIHLTIIRYKRAKNYSWFNKKQNKNLSLSNDFLVNDATLYMFMYIFKLIKRYLHEIICSTIDGFVYISVIFVRLLTKKRELSFIVAVSIVRAR